MGVDHRRLNVRVTHERLDVSERERLDGQGAEGMAQVVEAHPLEPSVVQGRIEAPAQGALLDVAPGRVLDKAITRFPTRVRDRDHPAKGWRHETLLSDTGKASPME